jgi:glycosyltransferase involved in cell wall biosynthesis
LEAKDNRSRVRRHVNILHVLSQYEVTGAETYAATLIGQQVRAGHRALVVSDTFHTPVEAEVLAMPIGRRDYPQRLSNVAALRRLIRSRGIELVHAHSRAASWVAFVATRASPAPLVSTLHILQTPHLSARTVSIYGEEVIAVSAAIEENALRALHLPREHVHLLFNGVDLDHFRPGASRGDARRALDLPVEGPLVALVGRLTAERAVAARLVVSEVLPRVRGSVPDVGLAVVGGMQTPEGFGALVAAVNRRLEGEPVRHLGHQTDVAPWLAAADVVVAGGRSAIEALAVGRPVLALGLTHYLGVVGEATAGEALRSNFGDFGPPRHVDAARIAADLASLLRDHARREALARWGRAFAERHFDVAALWPRVEGVYRRALADKGHLVRDS